MAIIAFASSSKKACVVKLLQNSCLSLLSQKKYAKKIFYAKFKKKFHPSCVILKFQNIEGKECRSR